MSHPLLALWENAGFQPLPHWVHFWDPQSFLYTVHPAWALSGVTATVSPCRFPALSFVLVMWMMFSKNISVKTDSFPDRFFFFFFFFEGVHCHHWSDVLLDSKTKNKNEFLCSSPLPVSPCSPLLLLLKKKNMKRNRYHQGERQDSECTQLKCYLGFGNCGLGGLFGQNARGIEKETEKLGEKKKKNRQNTHTQRGLFLRPPRARDIICELSAGMAARWGLRRPRRSNLVAKPLLILNGTEHIRLQLQLHTVWAGIHIKPISYTAKEWEVFSFMFLHYLSKCSARPLPRIQMKRSIMSTVLPSITL